MQHILCRRKHVHIYKIIACVLHLNKVFVILLHAYIYIWHDVHLLYLVIAGRTKLYIAVRDHNRSVYYYESVSYFSSWRQLASFTADRVLASEWGYRRYEWGWWDSVWQWQALSNRTLVKLLCQPKVMHRPLSHCNSSHPWRSQPVSCSSYRAPLCSFMSPFTYICCYPHPSSLPASSPSFSSFRSARPCRPLLVWAALMQMLMSGHNSELSLTRATIDNTSKTESANKRRRTRDSLTLSHSHSFLRALFIVRFSLFLSRTSQSEALGSLGATRWEAREPATSSFVASPLRSLPPMPPPLLRPADEDKWRTVKG